MKAEEIKEALRRHHPGERQGTFVGQWTCVEEWCGIDLLALDAWASANVIGYEVKVSRGDLRNELLNPTKRMLAVSRCTQFYFAVPRGLLKPEELEFSEPDWELEDFEREPCPGYELGDYQEKQRQDRAGRSFYGAVGGKCRNPRHGRTGRRARNRYRAIDPYDGKPLPKGFLVRLPVPVVLKPTSYVGYPEKHYTQHDVDQAREGQGFRYFPCPTCAGRGHSQLSRVELDAPTLWVPKDVGLVEIDQRGVVVTKRAPRNKMPESILGRPSDRLDEVTRNRIQRQAINDFARWVSNRPDPRHR